MAKVTIKCGNVTVEAENQKELFETLATYQEVFSHTACPGCENTNLRYRVRETPDAKGKIHKYYEIVCEKCWTKLPFGQHQGGVTLFPKKWVRYNKDTKQSEEL